MSSPSARLPEIQAVADTSVFIGIEDNRIDGDAFALRAAVSVITIAELRLGVLTATTLEARARRLATLRLAESLDPVPIDDSVADAWAMLVASLRKAGKRVSGNDSWIAATALARKLPVATRNSGYESMPGVQVIRV